jgi:ATP-binding cassette, subfamily B, bacterial
MLREFFAYYRPHRTLFVIDFSCAVLSGLLELAFPVAVTSFVDKLLPSQNWGLILGAAAGLLLIYLLNTGLQYVVNRCTVSRASVPVGGMAYSVTA